MKKIFLIIGLISLCLFISMAEAQEVCKEVDGKACYLDGSEVIDKVCDTYTYSTYNHCVNDICTMSIGGSYALDTDGKWKPIEDASSLMNSNVRLTLVEKDDNYNIEIVDYNYTSIKYRLDVKDEKSLKDIPVTVYDSSKIVSSSKSYTFKDVNESKEDVLLFSNPFDKEIHFGKSSTVIILNETNNGNVGDSYTLSQFPTTNAGTATQNLIAQGLYNKRAHILWNLSVLPNGISVSNSNLSVTHIFSADNVVIKVFNSSNSWTEGNVTWNTKPNTSTLYCTYMARNSAGVSYGCNITNAIISQLTRDKNMSITLMTNENGTSETSGIFGKEDSTATVRPQLNITYSFLSPPTWSLNQTNSTLAGNTTKHSVYWSQGEGLSSYIFQFCNGTWNGTMCRNAPVSNTHLVVKSTTTGDLADIYASDLSTKYIIAMKFNISTIPINAIIDKAFVNLYMFDKAAGGPDTDVTVWMIPNQSWVESPSVGGFNTMWSIKNNQTSSTLNATPGVEVHMNFSIQTQISACVNSSYVNCSIVFQDPDSTYGGTATTIVDNADLNWGGITASKMYYTDREDRWGYGIYPWLSVDYHIDSAWVNDTAVAMTGTGNWSNVSKVINSTVGSNIAWKVYANDTGNRWNSTNIFNYTTTVSTGAANSCTYTSGKWTISCADNCVLSTTTTMDGSELQIGGAGSLQIKAPINNHGDVRIGGTGYCDIQCNGGCW